MNDLLELTEKLIANGDPETIIACSTPDGALARAKDVFSRDETARDFGTPAALALYLRGLAQPQRRDAIRALAEPDHAPSWPLTPAAQLHVDGVVARAKAAAVEAARAEADRVEASRLPVPAAPLAAVAIAAAPAAQPVADLTDEEIQVAFGLPRAHARGLQWVLDEQLHLRPCLTDGVMQYSASVIAKRVGSKVLAERIARQLDRRFAAATASATVEARRAALERELAAIGI